MQKEHEPRLRSEVLTYPPEPYSKEQDNNNANPQEGDGTGTGIGNCFGREHQDDAIEPSEHLPGYHCTSTSRYPANGPHGSGSSLSTGSPPTSAVASPRSTHSCSTHRGEPLPGPSFPPETHSPGEKGSKPDWFSFGSPPKLPNGSLISDKTHYPSNLTIDTDGANAIRSSSNGMPDLEQQVADPATTLPSNSAANSRPGFTTPSNVRYVIRRGREVFREPSFVEKLLLAFCAVTASIITAILSYLLFLGKGHKKMAHAAFIGGTLALMILTAIVTAILRRPYGEVIISVILVVCTGFFVIQQLDDLML